MLRALGKRERGVGGRGGGGLVTGPGDGKPRDLTPETCTPHFPSPHFLRWGGGREDGGSWEGEDAIMREKIIIRILPLNNFFLNQ